MEMMPVSEAHRKGALRGSAIQDWCAAQLLAGGEIDGLRVISERINEAETRLAEYDALFRSPFEASAAITQNELLRQEIKFLLDEIEVLRGETK